MQVLEARAFPAAPGGSNLLAAPIGPEDALRTVGPFVVVGHHREAAREPGGLPVDADVRPHPHIGLCAVTCAIVGGPTHRDSLGCRQELEPGSLGILHAGRGAVHSERFERRRVHGGPFEIYQLLLALPDGAEETEPSFTYAS